MKKIICIVLALVMVMGLATTAFAYDITVTDSEDGATVAGHTYNVYQIFKGKLYIDDKDTEDKADDEAILSDIVYGKNYGTEDAEVPQTLLDELKAKSGEAAAAYLQPGVTGDPIAVLNDGNNHKATGLDAGYYLIVDVTKDLPEGETSSAYILQVLDNVVVNSKHTNIPKVVKKIDDKNDSNTSEDKIVWHDSADHDIGDLIDFQLEMTVPAAFDLFKEAKKAYTFTFHDTEEKGLTFQPDSVVVKVDDVEINTGYEVKYPAGDGHTFDVVFANLTAIPGVEVGSVITVAYKSQLNENAVIGSTGNVNEVYGEFGNFYKPEEPIITPKDTVIAFTYQVVVNKVDGENKPLSGAEFTLEKFVANAEGTETYKDVKGNWVALETVETEPDTTFTFEGLDDGEYRLTETKTPAGYNSIDPIYFTVTAGHDEEWTTQPRLEVLNSLTGDVVEGVIEFEVVEEDGKLSTDVVNKAGVELPETGGIGTTIFYILGAALALGAVVILITRRRMTGEN